jgi:DNA-binding beta-propeller fold protein YncE
MIALAYVVVLVFFGDAVARRWFSFVSWPHRLATGFLVGLLLGTWTSYLAAFAFRDTGDPVALGTLVSSLVLVGVAAWLRRRPASPARPPSSPLRSVRADWAMVLLVAALASWMMVSTYSYADGTLKIAGDLWSDFGPTTAIAQSFALGHNVPTEYPHYALEPIRYHFLFYFQVGNLTYLGLDPAMANNLLSIASVVALLVIVAALGERLFASRWVGWIGAALFFFHGALSFIPYLASFPSIGQALEALPGLDHFLASGFPYRGEEWGIWTQDVFLNQRHLPSAIGIVLIIVLFLVDRLPQPDGVREGDRGALRQRFAASLVATRRRLAAGLARPTSALATTLGDPWLPGFLLCGLMAGLLPLYNGSMFIAAAVVLGGLLVLFPNRPQMLFLAAIAAVSALPQLLLLRPGTMAGEQAYPLVFWGYTIDDPTPVRVATYAAFIFGPKLLLVGLALLAGTWVQRRVFIAFSGLVALAFLVQFSVEVLANHKFINAWLVVANLFVAYGLVRLWNARRMLRVPARLVAAGLAFVIVAGGIIDLVPVKNQRIYEVGLTGDRLYEWARTETRPSDVFLSDIFVVHGILLAGRRLYLGWPYYSWSAGYAVRDREQTYRDLFALRSTRELVGRLQAIGIDFVAFDDGLRDRGFAPRLNEELYHDNMEAVFTDPENRYGHLTIYRVPSNPETVDSLPEAPPEDMYAGDGSDPGMFDGPRGLALERSGALILADSGNHRVGRFSSSGNLLGWLGDPPANPGPLDHPTGVAVNSRGEVYVADRGRLLAYDASGVFARQWTGADEPFGDLVDVAIDGSDRVYALDAANGRVIRLDPDGTTTTWGAAGSAAGELRGPSGLAVASGKVVVGDVGNARIVVFDDQGTLLEARPVPEWDGPEGLAADVAIDPGGTIWASSPATNSILVYRPDGTLAGSLNPTGAESLDEPSGLVVRQDGALFVSNLGAGRVVLLTRPIP